MEGHDRQHVDHQAGGARDGDGPGRGGGRGGGGGRGKSGLPVWKTVFTTFSFSPFWSPRQVPDGVLHLLDDEVEPVPSGVGEQPGVEGGGDDGQVGFRPLPREVGGVALRQHDETEREREREKKRNF